MQEVKHEIVKQPPQNQRIIRTAVLTRAKLREANRLSDEMDISDSNSSQSVKCAEKIRFPSRSHSDMDISEHTSGTLKSDGKKTLPTASQTHNGESVMLISPENTCDLLGKLTHIVKAEEESARPFNQTTINSNEQMSSEGTAKSNIERESQIVRPNKRAADQTQNANDTIVVDDEIAYNQRMDELLSQNLSVDLSKSLQTDEECNGYTLQLDRTSYVPVNMLEDSLDLGDFNTESFESRIILKQSESINRTQELNKNGRNGQTQLVNVEIEEDFHGYTPKTDRTSYAPANMLNDSLDPCSSCTDTFELRLQLQNQTKLLHQTIAQELNTKEDQTKFFHQTTAQELDITEVLRKYKQKVNRTSDVPANMELDPVAQRSLKTESCENAELRNQTITQDIKLEPKHVIEEIPGELMQMSPNKSLSAKEDTLDDSSHSKSNLLEDSKVIDFTMPLCSTRFPDFVGDFSENHIDETSDNCLLDSSISGRTQSGAQSYNTDDLCHLNAEQLCAKGAVRTIDTAMQSLQLSGINRAALELSSGDVTVGMPSGRLIEPLTSRRRTTRPRRSTAEYRCKKCKNCKRSIQSTSSVSSGSLLQHDPLGDTTCLRTYKLDFSRYAELEGKATVHNVIQAFEKRRQAAEAATNIVVDDQNVPAPDFHFLFDNKMKA